MEMNRNHIANVISFLINRNRQNEKANRTIHEIQFLTTQ